MGWLLRECFPNESINVELIDWFGFMWRCHLEIGNDKTEKENEKQQGEGEEKQSRKSSQICTKKSSKIQINFSPN
jgi:hypothetical protein